MDKKISIGGDSGEPQSMAKLNSLLVTYENTNNRYKSLLTRLEKIKTSIIGKETMKEVVKDVDKETVNGISPKFCVNLDIQMYLNSEFERLLDEISEYV